MSNRGKNVTRFAAVLVAGTAISLSSSAGAADLDFAPAPMMGYPSTAVFTGLSVKEDAWYAYFGGTHALNGNLSIDGWLIRAAIGGGEVEYNAGGGLGSIDSDIFDADLMLGYQIFEGRNRYTAYIGANYHDNDLSPNDPGNSTSGDEFGAKVQLEADSWIGDLINLGAIGSYSTANDAYWARLRLGYDIGGWLIGPEGIVGGDDEYDEQRIGAFIGGIPLGGAVNVSFSVGYADTSRGDDSIYGTVGLSTAF